MNRTEFPATEYLANKWLTIVFLLTAILGTDLVVAQNVSHPLVINGNGKLAVLNAEGEIQWQTPWTGIHDIHVLETAIY